MKKSVFRYYKIKWKNNYIRIFDLRHLLYASFPSALIVESNTGVLWPDMFYSRLIVVFMAMYPFKNSESPGPSEKWGPTVLEKGQPLGVFFYYISRLSTHEHYGKNELGYCRFFYIQTKFEKKIFKTKKVINPWKIAGKAETTVIYQSFQNGWVSRCLQIIKKPSVTQFEIYIPNPG